MALTEVSIDPITYEVVRHRIWQITDEMGIALKHVSVSPVVTEVNDFSTGIHLADGSSVSMGSYVEAHFGSAPTIVRSVIADCSDDPGIEEEDMFITNDPWKGILHQGDVAIVAPLHSKGELVGWTQCTAHQLDIGAIVPGSFAVTQEVYQEGLRMPPTKVISRGEIRNDLLRMIMNMIRLPQVILDFKGLIAANYVARRRVYELFEKYGTTTVLETWREIIRRSEARFKARLREFPDGNFSHIDRIEHDGFERGNYELRLTMTKKGDDLIFDFTGTKPQARGSINCTLSGTMAGICGALLPNVCADIPWNEGVVGAFKVIAPTATLCNATVPAPVGRASVTASWLVKNASQACIGKMMATSPAHSKESMAVWMGNQALLVISGFNQFGDRFGHIFLDTIAGGCGATATHDGMDCAGDAYVITLLIANVESHEATNPVLFLYRRRLSDSGGAGKFRGGVSMEQALTPYGTDRVRATALAHGVEMPNAAGIFGGYPGCQSAFRLLRKSDLRKMMDSGKLPHTVSDLKGVDEKLSVCVPSIWIEQGDIFHYYWSGGGGYGDPLDRDPNLVVNDYIDGVVTLEAARQIYGVVIDETGKRIDREATEKLRSSLKRARISSSG